MTLADSSLLLSFALRMTRASSRNIGKFYYYFIIDLKCRSNLHSFMILLWSTLPVLVVMQRLLLSNWKEQRLRSNFNINFDSILVFFANFQNINFSHKCAFNIHSV